MKGSTIIPPFRPSEASLQAVLRRVQLGSGVVMLAYLFLHLTNHALGLWSLELAGRGLAMALRLWRSTPGTIALYGAPSLHFSLALHTIYRRRHWELPAAEWIRLWAGLSLPLLLIRHTVTTRLASTLYGFEPNYEQVVGMLLTSGTQGLQLALLAPGWVHGCLGLWFRLRHYPLAQRMKLALLAAAALLPLLSAGGFIRMMQAVEMTSVTLRAPDPKLVTHQFTLDAWRHHLIVLYLCLIVGAFIGGQLRNGLERRRQRQTG